MQIDRYVAERRRKQKKRRSYFWAAAGFLAAYFIVLGIFFFIVRSPAFQTDHITIEGNNAVSTSTIMNLLEANIPKGGIKTLLGFNNMLIWPPALPTSTLAVIPQLAGLTISKNYFLHAITVTVTERVPFAVWCLMPSAAMANEACFWFDSQGLAFEKTFDTQGGAIMVIHDYAEDKLAPGEKILPSEFIPNMISIVNTLKASNLGIQEIALHDLSLQQVDITTMNGPSIYFSLRFSAAEDLPVLQKLMVAPGFSKLQYVDFTVENRAYYK